MCNAFWHHRLVPKMDSNKRLVCNIWCQKCDFFNCNRVVKFWVFSKVWKYKRFYYCKPYGIKTRNNGWNEVNGNKKWACNLVRKTLDWRLVLFLLAEDQEYTLRWLMLTQVFLANALALWRMRLLERKVVMKLTIVVR